MAYVELENILEDVYGVKLLEATPVCILWAAERIENIDSAKKQLKQVNRVREKYGRMPVDVPYGHKLF